MEKLYYKVYQDIENIIDFYVDTKENILIMFETPVYFGDKVSNNFGTDKEVIREVVEYEGCMMLKRIKGKSRLPKYISLHEFHKLNFRIIK